VSISG